MNSAGSYASLLLLFVTSCTAPAETVQVGGLAPLQYQADIRPVWHGYGSVETQSAIRGCLDRERSDGDVSECSRIQTSASLNEADGPPRFLSIRQASWVVIDDWAAVMQASLAWLRDHGPRDTIEASQVKWEAALSADIGLYMDMFKGGSMSSQMATIGAGIRADATIKRVLFLEQFRALLEVNE